LAAADIDPPAAGDFQQRGLLALDRAGDRIFARARILNRAAADLHVLAVGDADAGRQFLVAIVGIVVEAVRTDHDVARALDEQIAPVPAIDHVLPQHHSAA